MTKVTKGQLKLLSVLNVGGQQAYVVDLLLEIHRNATLEFSQGS